MLSCPRTLFFLIHFFDFCLCFLFHQNNIIIYSQNHKKNKKTVQMILTKKNAKHGAENFDPGNTAQTQQQH